MHEQGYDWNRPYRKSARVVGDVIGKYHPHGNDAVYVSLVRMAQEFSLRVTLIDGQGNFGSVDGDMPAAMRYTEVRMEKVTNSLLEDLDKDTVDFKDNYDDSEREPTVLPARFPNLLVNGGSGIAVGMATNIPTHNLGEVIDATLLLMDRPDGDGRRPDRGAAGPGLPDRRHHPRPRRASARPTRPGAARSWCAGRVAHRGDPRRSAKRSSSPRSPTR